MNRLSFTRKLQPKTSNIFMIHFKAILKKFAEQGEKTGWTFIEVSSDLAQQLKPNNKKSFRVKLTLDGILFEAVAMIPMGEGTFIMAINAGMRKAIRKQRGEEVNVIVEIDEKGYQINTDFVACLQDEPHALNYFNTLPKGHQIYFSKWIESTKTIETKSKRIANSILYLSKQQGYGEMIRGLKR